MCGLYGFLSSAPRRVECELLRAQNASIHQMLEERGEGEGASGWGLAVYEDGDPVVERQVGPTVEGHVARQRAADRRAKAVLSHVHRGTVGPASEENTQPFVHGPWSFAHCGTIEAFEEIRDRMIDAIHPDYRDRIAGETDSEHLFYLLLSVSDREPDRSRRDVLRGVLHRIIEWSAEASPGASVTAAIIWTDGTESVGARFGRPLWFVERDAVHPCQVHDGTIHGPDSGAGPYRDVVLASEQVTTDEEWMQVPDRSIVGVNAQLEISVEVL